MKQQPDNKRRAARLHHEIPVAYRSVGSFLTDWATNISRGGLFINTRKPLAVGTAVKIIIQLPGAAFPYEMAGRVTRVTQYDNPNRYRRGLYPTVVRNNLRAIREEPSESSGPG